MQLNLRRDKEKYEKVSLQMVTEQNYAIWPFKMFRGEF